MEIDLSVNDKNISTMIRNLGFKGNVELLLTLYKNEIIHNVLKEEIELALFNSVSSCVRDLEFDKLKLLINNPFINENLRLHAEMSYEKRKFLVKDSSDVLEVPKCLSCKNCTCKKDEIKLKNAGN